jgi:hypothetical protein
MASGTSMASLVRAKNCRAVEPSAQRERFLGAYEFVAQRGLVRPDRAARRAGRASRGQLGRLEHPGGCRRRLDLEQVAAAGHLLEQRTRDAQIVRRRSPRQRQQRSHQTAECRSPDHDCALVLTKTG